MKSVICVLYHNIADRETDFERGLGVTCSRADFTTHVDFFSRRYNFIDLDALLSGDLPDDPLLMTFDDWYLSSLEAVEAVLAPRGIPSVFFLTPGLLGTDCFPLDNLIAYGVNTRGAAETGRLMDAPEADRHSAAGLIGGFLSTRSRAERQDIQARLLATLAPGPEVPRARSLTKADIARFAPAGIEIGNHTASHVHCRALTADDRGTEIAGAKARLEALSGQRVRAFSIPYGLERDAPPAIMAAIRDAGHEAIFLVHARSNAFRNVPDLWYRVAFHAGTMRAPGARVTVLPMLRSFKAMLGR